MVMRCALTLTLILGGAVAAGSTRLAAGELGMVAELSRPPGNVAVTPAGTVLFSQHPFFDPEYPVMRLTDDGDAVPFPNRAWATPPGPEGRGLHSVLGIIADQQGIVWMLDNGGHQPRIVAWDTRTDSLHRVITLPRHAAPEGSFLNDAAVDIAHDALYIADSGRNEPAIIVVDLRTGRSRRVLAGHPSVVPEDDVPLVIGGRTITTGTGEDAQPARVGINPITIDPTNRWVYYGAMNGRSIYHLPARALADMDLEADELASMVETYGTKPASEGITIDDRGNVYVTDLGDNAIGITRADGRYQVYLQDPRLEWPGGFAMGPDGYVYVVVSQLHRSAFLNKGRNTAEPPYYLLRFRPRGEAVVGR